MDCINQEKKLLPLVLHATKIIFAVTVEHRPTNLLFNSFPRWFFSFFVLNLLCLLHQKEPSFRPWLYHKLNYMVVFIHWNRSAEKCWKLLPATLSSTNCEPAVVIAIINWQIKNYLSKHCCLAFPENTVNFKLIHGSERKISAEVSFFLTFRRSKLWFIWPLRGWRYVKTGLK